MLTSRYLIAALALSGMVTALALPGVFSPHGASARADDATALVMTRCTECHATDRICEYLGRDADWWDDTIGRMMAKGARIDGDQKDGLVAYLHGLEPGAGPVCP